LERGERKGPNRLNHISHNSNNCFSREERKKKKYKERVEAHMGVVLAALTSFVHFVLYEAKVESGERTLEEQPTSRGPYSCFFSARRSSGKERGKIRGRKELRSRLYFQRILLLSINGQVGKRQWGEEDGLSF